jgi:hypothetical protein
MASNNQLMGGNTTAPNRAPAAKVIAGALANERVAQSLITALGAYSIILVVASAHASATTDFGSLLVGDYVIDITTPQGGQVVTAGTSPFVPTAADFILVLRAVNLDSNNPLPYNTLNGNKTGNGGTEF